MKLNGYLLASAAFLGAAICFWFAHRPGWSAMNVFLFGVAGLAGIRINKP